MRALACLAWAEPWRRAARQVAAIGVAAAILPLSATAAPPETLDCSQFNIDPGKSASLGGDGAERPEVCKVRMKNGIPLPDPNCTPGAINPTLTAKVLRNPDFRTSCVRDNATSASQKAQTYGLYQIAHPANNKGVMQICELDHLISLELGGADTLDNIWPQCGPTRVILRARFFKKKDAVENYLAKRVKEGSMNLKDAQQAIASDWTQFLEEALNQCHGAKCDD
jgi:hypothetical protein